MASKSDIGKIGWMDLTVDDADGVLEFYKAVTGWSSSGISMGDYEDYCVNPPTEESPVGGICHKRGPNAEIPSQWMMYITVENLDNSMTECDARGGKVIIRDRSMGAHGRMSIIQDPAGAVCAIIEPPFE